MPRTTGGRARVQGSNRSSFCFACADDWARHSNPYPQTGDLRPSTVPAALVRKTKRDRESQPSSLIRALQSSARTL
jgi:hypothetical protein